MKKILLIIGLTLFTTLAYSQKPKVSAVRYTAVTTTERDNYSVPAGEFWRIYNTTTTQNEYWDGDSWEALSISEATFNLNSKNYSWGQSYIENWGKSVLDLGATYFPNNGGYEIGRLHQAETKTSLHFIPAAVGEGVIYSIGKNRTNDLTVARNSIATYVDEDGIIQTAAIDFAHIDYTDGDGAFLIENQSTNLALWSEELDNGVNVLTRASVAVNTTISPDGTLNADTLTATDTNAQFQQVHNGTSGLTYTVSVWIKRKTGTGQINIRSVENIATPITITNEWIRYSLATESTSTTIRAGVNIMTNGDEVYIWGVQIEQQIVSSSNIKTENVTVTRLADVITGAGDVNTFSEEGVLYVEMAALSDDLTNRRISISDGTNVNRVVIHYGNISNRISALYVIGSSAVASLSFSASDITNYSKIAFKYSENDFALWVDGIERDTEPSGAVLAPDILTVFGFKDGAGSPFYGKIRESIIFNVLSDSELELLTKMFGFMFLCRIRRKETEYKTAA